jgi:hypothetical protein
MQKAAEESSTANDVGNGQRSGGKRGPNVTK